jgi:hypothetical protein
MKMQRGFANLALAAKVDVQALLMICTPPCLSKGAHWYEIPACPISFVLREGSKFLHADYSTEAPRSIRVRALMRDIQQYYDRCLQK